jgi:APA family basic amino acid/polyamine antiporter
VVVSVALLAVRARGTAADRPFRAPFGPLFPLLSAGSSGLLMLALPGAAALLLTGWLLAGLIVYSAYGRRHSLLAAARTVSAPAADCAVPEPPAGVAG